ncbi:MAG: hypothetical protein ACRESZ_10480, partial [Methylococcales bacterium]
MSRTIPDLDIANGMGGRRHGNTASSRSRVGGASPSRHDGSCNPTTRGDFSINQKRFVNGQNFSLLFKNEGRLTFIVFG